MKLWLELRFRLFVLKYRLKRWIHKYPEVSPPKNYTPEDIERNVKAAIKAGQHTIKISDVAENKRKGRDAFYGIKRSI